MVLFLFAFSGVQFSRGSLLALDRSANVFDRAHERIVEVPAMGGVSYRSLRWQINVPLC